MRKFIKGADYLCVIGVPKSTEEPRNEVGEWVGDMFAFSNGCYDRCELRWFTDTRPTNGNNCMRVLKARKI